MPVTILYQGVPLTFPNLDSPDEAYKQLGESPTAPATTSSDESATDAPATYSPNKEGSIDPKLLTENKDWLQASRTMYEASQGHKWDDKEGDAKLAEWGLDRMARFNYNLPLMGVDALAIKDAPEAQKRAFLYMLDTFEKTNYTWSGAGRAAKYMAMDPTNYVGGLGTLGVGVAASRAASITTTQGVKAALKVGLQGAIEGGIYGGVQSRLEQEARVNAGGQDDVDYGRVATGAGLGAAFGGITAPAIAIGANKLLGKEASKLASDIRPEPEAAPAVTPELTKQGELPLDNSFQTMTDKADREGSLGVPETATQPTLPGFAQNDLSRPVPFEGLPLQRNLDALPDFARPAPAGPSIDEEAERLMAKWDVSHQAEMFPNHPEDRRLPAAPGEDGPIKLESSTAQGNLFDDLPVQTRQAIDDVVTDLTDRNNQTSGVSDAMRSLLEQDGKAKPKTGILDSIPKPKPDEKIGGTNGPSLLDLKRVLQSVGQKIGSGDLSGWKAFSDVSSPLTRALMHLTAADAKEIAARFGESAMTKPEYEGFTRATIDAQNNIKAYIDDLLAKRALAATPESKAAFTDKIVTAEKIMDPLKLLAKEAGSTSGRTLAMQRQNLFKGLQRDANLDTILRDMGLDRVLASSDQKADAIQKWFQSIADNEQAIKKMDNLLDLRNRIASSSDPLDINAMMADYAKLTNEARQELYGGLSPLGKINENRRALFNAIGRFEQHTVLTPSSLTTNFLSNAAMVFSRPLMDGLASSTDQVAMRQVLTAYGAMWRVGPTALRYAMKAMETGRSMLTGADPKFLETAAHALDTNTGAYSTLRYAGGNLVSFFTRLLGATDEFFQVVSYQGAVEFNAVGRALKAAQGQGLDKAATDKLVRDYLEHIRENAYHKGPDATIVGILRERALKKGLSEDAIPVFIQNELDKNGSWMRRAKDEEGINYTNDLLFKREFSGDNFPSSVAKFYEKSVANVPELRLLGQLFFRTPVRVFEEGLRLTPGVQFAVPNFMNDYLGKNGLAKQVRAQGEMMFAYGALASVVTAYATGHITGTGLNMTPQEREVQEAAGWRPYSIKYGDGKYFNFRNLDPISTPVKIIVNALERLRMQDLRQAQGEMDKKGTFASVAGYASVGLVSILAAVRDANLTAGAAELYKWFDALNDPERKEHALTQLVGSKAQLAVPNVIRRGVKSFGDGQNVSNYPTTLDQIVEASINPSSAQVTHKYDALGNPLNMATQGLGQYFGIDIADKATRGRGLPDRDQATLREIARMTTATGNTFQVDPKVGNIDLREQMSADGRTTLYNKVMSEFNRNMPDAAARMLQRTQELPIGLRGDPAQRTKAFAKLHTDLWKAAVHAVGRDEPAIPQALKDKTAFKASVLRGAHEVPIPSEN